MFAAAHRNFNAGAAEYDRPSHVSLAFACLVRTRTSAVLDYSVRHSSVQVGGRTHWTVPRRGDFSVACAFAQGLYHRLSHGDRSEYPAVSHDSRGTFLPCAAAVRSSLNLKLQSAIGFKQHGDALCCSFTECRASGLVKALREGVGFGVRVAD